MIAAAVTTACASSRGESSPRTFAGVPLAPNVHCADSACRSYNVDPYVLTRSRYGVGCLGNVPPGTTPRSDPPPQSYPASAVGKPGFPALAPSERSMLRRIQRYVHSKTLRLAWVGNHEFIVFDALDGPCEVSAPGYTVLNGTCNEVYEPGENPYDTHGVPGCFFTPPPWMRSSRR